MKLKQENTTMDKLLLTPLEAAEALSVSRSKLYELLAGGQLHSVRIDGCRRIRAGDLRTYVDRLGAAETDWPSQFRGVTEMRPNPAA